MSNLDDTPDQPADTEGLSRPLNSNPAATPVGGKLGVYSFWPTTCGVDNSFVTQPYVTASTPQQYEFYNYADNPGEVGNEALTNVPGPLTLTPLAAQYNTNLSGPGGIAETELYQPYEDIYAAYAAAYQAYLAAVNLGCTYVPGPVPN